MPGSEYLVGYSSSAVVNLPTVDKPQTDKKVLKAQWSQMHKGNKDHPITETISRKLGIWVTPMVYYTEPYYYTGYTKSCSKSKSV